MKKFKAISDKLIAKRKKQKNSSEEQNENKKTRELAFLNSVSGFTCVPYRFSDQFSEYVNSFEHNLEIQLDKMKLDEFNGAFKDEEIRLMCSYEKLSLKQQFILHKFENLKIENKLSGYLELLDGEISLIQMSEKILEPKEEIDYEKI